MNMRIRKNTMLYVGLVVVMVALIGVRSLRPEWLYGLPITPVQYFVFMGSLFLTYSIYLLASFIRTEETKRKKMFSTLHMLVYFVLATVSYYYAFEALSI